MGDGLGELEAHVCGGYGAGGLLAKWTVDQLGALLLGELGDIAAARDLGVVGDRGGASLDLGLLLRSRVGGRRVEGELVVEELVVVLVD